MLIELDHLFICTAPEAPEAEKFVEFGLLEGPPNQHAGQKVRPVVVLLLQMR